MDGRVFVLTIPSAAILGALVYHSLRALPRTRALAFWASVAAYGLLRGIAVHLVTEKGLGASFPYVIRHPLFSVFGVSLQEIAGWAIVSYLGWWLGFRFARSPQGELSIAGGLRELSGFLRREASGTRSEDVATWERRARLFPQVLWACLFLGAISWAVESAAISAGWWYWTIPARGTVLINVPFIGMVDWFFVGIDFLLPFTVISSGVLRRSRLWLLTLSLFPIHFASHAFTGRPGDLLPIPFFHLVHWGMLGLTVWLALRSNVEDPAFHAKDRASGWVPPICIALMLADLAMVDAVWVRRPSLLPSILPAFFTALVSLTPTWGLVASFAALVFALFQLPLILAAVPGGMALLLRWAGREAPNPSAEEMSRWASSTGTATSAPVAGESSAHRRNAGRGRTRWTTSRPSLSPPEGRAVAVPRLRWRAPAVLAMMALMAFGIHSEGAKRDLELKSRLGAALDTRDRGDVEGAVMALRRLIEDFPDSHATRALLGEIYYKTNRLDQARAEFEAAVEIKHDFMMGRRYLAVIELQKGNRAAALAQARTGLELKPDDLELRYVEARASGTGTYAVWSRAEAAGPPAVEGLASLALESGDAQGAADALDRAIERWPSRSNLYSARVRLALSQGDLESARRVTGVWRSRLPDDPQARSLAARLGLPG